MTADPRIEQIRAVLAYVDEHEQPSPYTALRRIRAILDSAPPAPRVFFPGDTVPADTVVINQFGQTFRNQPPWKVFWSSRGMVEVFGVPSREEWQAAVDRARAERGEA